MLGWLNSNNDKNLIGWRELVGKSRLPCKQEDSCLGPRIYGKSCVVYIYNPRDYGFQSLNGQVVKPVWRVPGKRPWLWKQGGWCLRNEPQGCPLTPTPMCMYAPTFKHMYIRIIKNKNTYIHQWNTHYQDEEKPVISNDTEKSSHKIQDPVIIKTKN